MERVFIVGAVEGDYENRKVWVCGVYGTREEAQKAVDEALTRARAWRYWSRRRIEVHDCINRLEAVSTGRFEERPAEEPAIMRWIRQAREAQAEFVGPEPPQEDGDYFYIAEVPIGQWGKFIIDDEDEPSGPLVKIAASEVIDNTGRLVMMTAGTIVHDDSEEGA
jgi:hypothetical protein